MNSKEYTLPDGRTVVFWYDENEIGKITLEAMDTLISMITEQWTPCSDQLPEEGHTYLVTIEFNDGSRGVDMDEYFSYGWDDYGLGNVGRVIAWKPEPEPYWEDKK